MALHQDLSNAEYIQTLICLANEWKLENENSDESRAMQLLAVHILQTRIPSFLAWNSLPNQAKEMYYINRNYFYSFFIFMLWLIFNIVMYDIIHWNLKRPHLGRDWIVW